jgi:sugar phosphate isomerase/epimerase
MSTIKGPAIFLAQFAADAAPFNSLEAIAHWAHDLGYVGVQIPAWDGRLFDLRRAAESQTYCGEVIGTLRRYGLEINGRSGVYGGYQSWIDRPGRFRSPGDGQVDFGGIFSKLAAYGYDGWAVLEWECCLKHPEDGAREGAPFVRRHLIRTPDRAFDAFAASGADERLNRHVLGLEDTERV